MRLAEFAQPRAEPAQHERRKDEINNPLHMVYNLIDTRIGDKVGTMRAPVEMKKYAVLFTIAYFLITVVVAGIAYFIDIGGGTGLNVAAAMIASFFAGSQFAKEQGRAPTHAEKHTYSLMALASIWVVSLLLVVAAVAFLLPAKEIQALLGLVASGIFPIAAAVGAAALSLVYYFVIKWAFSWNIKKA